MGIQRGVQLYSRDSACIMTELRGREILLISMLSAIGLILNTIFCGLLLYLVALVRLLLPVRSLRKACDRSLIKIAEFWVTGNSANFDRTLDVQWDIKVDATLMSDESYLICSNHQSWVDILILQRVFNKRVPFLRFFIKQELRYVPILGGAWALLDYPFMKRYSKAYLEKHPEKRGEDLATAKRALEKFRQKTVSILNFPEGTRFTLEKHDQQKSPYRHLLLPKAGGMAATLEGLSGQISKILDVTIFYPQGPINLVEFLRGRLSRVVVHVREIPVPFSFIEGEYQRNPEFREKVQAWVSELWREKDKRLQSLS